MTIKHSAMIGVAGVPETGSDMPGLKTHAMKPAPLIIFASLFGVAGCSDPGPITVEQAMAQCTERARAAVKPDVSVGVGIGIGHKVRTGVGIGIGLSSDYLKGTPPEEVYETCVVAKSGENPTQPLKL